MLNNKISLKAFNIVAFISLFIIVFSGLYYQYMAANQSTSENFINDNYNQSLEIKEKFRTIFDKLEYEFIQAEAENIKKLDQLSEIVANQKSNFDLQKTVTELNKNVTFGRYDVAIINQDYIIEQASIKQEIGLDLGQFKDVKTLFNSLFDNKIKLNISSPKIDLNAKLKRYLLKLSEDQKYILQVGFSLDYIDEIHTQLHYLNTESSAIKLYLATEFFIQQINAQPADVNSKNEEFKNLTASTKAFLLDLNNALNNPEIEDLANQDRKQVNLNKSLAKIVPLNEQLMSFVDEAQNTINFYSATGALFGEESATLLFIKTTFSLAPLNNSLRNNLNTFLFISVLVLLVLIFFELFKKREITSKLSSISHMIKNNKMIDNKTSRIKDISILIKSYNEMLARLNQQIAVNKELSYIDTLTGVKNRRAYDEKIQELISLYQRYDTTFSIGLFDADNFKQINDNHGHSYGDIVLKDIAKQLQTNKREGDLVFRIGGEEFIVILPNTNLLNSQNVLDKMRTEIRKNLTYQEEMKITVSIGLTEVTKQDDKYSLFKRVDKFLYIAKKRGKNQVSHDHNSPNN
ncbi:GGDEF domain-containing protein [Psychromonas sp. GE-S-Ul-11]|uniref:GGDEF domain-containing protein n=2 Tax=Psychromonas sp. GE-S-Ul-11 TaxID=3241170 RepID=UPI00390CAE1F